jgi:hypothetical protein
VKESSGDSPSESLRDQKLAAPYFFRQCAAITICADAAIFPLRTGATLMDVLDYFHIGRRNQAVPKHFVQKR